MMHQIKDGTGSGQLAKVDGTNRLFTRAVSTSSVYEATVDSDGYLLGSGIVNLTNTNKSSVIYVENNEPQDLYITRIIITSEASTGSTLDNFLLSGTRNPTGLTSGSGNSASTVNTNFGSTKLLDTTSEKGLQGATTSGGAPIFAAYFATQNTHFIDQDFVLTTGNSIAFEVTPPAGNTSFNISLGMNCHLVKP